MANLSQEEIDKLMKNPPAAPEPGETDAERVPVPGGAEGGPGMRDSDDDILSAEEKDILGEVGNICMGAAATTMYALLGHRVTITTPRVQICRSDELLSVYKSPFVVVKVEYREGTEGTNLLLLKEQDSILITNLLMGSEERPAAGATLD